MSSYPGNSERQGPSEGEPYFQGKIPYGTPTPTPSSYLRYSQQRPPRQFGKRLASLVLVLLILAGAGLLGWQMFGKSLGGAKFEDDPAAQTLQKYLDAIGKADAKKALSMTNREVEGEGEVESTVFLTNSVMKNAFSPIRGLGISTRTTSDSKSPTQRFLVRFEVDGEDQSQEVILRRGKGNSWKVDHGLETRTALLQDSDTALVLPELKIKGSDAPLPLDGNGFLLYPGVYRIDTGMNEYVKASVERSPNGKLSVTGSASSSSGSRTVYAVPSAVFLENANTGLKGYIDSCIAATKEYRMLDKCGVNNIPVPSARLMDFDTGEITVKEYPTVEYRNHELKVKGGSFHGLLHGRNYSEQPESVEVDFETDPSFDDDLSFAVDPATGAVGVSPRG